MTADELLDHLEKRIRDLDPDLGEIILWPSEEGSIVIDWGNEQVQLEAATLREVLEAVAGEPFPIPGPNRPR